MDNKFDDFKILLLFLITSIVFTYPLILNLGTSLAGQKDPVLVTWIISWEVHSFTKDPAIIFHPSKLFNANIFYPNNDTLAFSEHMASISLVSLPIILIFDNPIFAYNINFLLSFILSGFGMYLLIHNLIKNRACAIIAGMIFAFSAFRFTQLIHLHILSTQWMPFMLLYLDKFLRNRTYKNMFIFNIFFILQILVSWYLAFYTVIIVLLYIIFQYIINKDIRGLLFNRSFQTKIIFFLIISMAVILPFVLPYVKANTEYNFSRAIKENEKYSANIVDYLSPPSNLLYGDITKLNFGHSLFLGLTVIFLSLHGLIPLIRSPKEYRKYDYQIFFIILITIAFILSLGPRLIVLGKTIFLPYYYLYNIPGINSMRVPSRFVVLVEFGMSILASYGALGLLKKFENRKRNVMGIFIISLILLESMPHIPISYSKFPSKDNIPEVYKWLNEKKEDFAIAEIPANSSNDPIYMYYSIFHWKKLVNGYSGFFPKDYQNIINNLNKFPSKKSINILRKIGGIRYIVIHSEKIDKQIFEMKVTEGLKYKDIRLIDKFGGDYVYLLKS